MTGKLNSFGIDFSSDETRVSDTIVSARRVCFFAHFHHLGRAADHVLYYLDGLRDAGFTTVVLSTATMDEEQASILRAHCAQLIFRDNVGLDFGGWAEAWQRYSGLTADLLLLTNDSVYGPVDNLARFIERLTATEADFYGAVESLTFEPHLQSWFLLLRPDAFRSDAFAKLMARMSKATRDKWDIIMDLELGFTRKMVEGGLRYHAAFRASRDTRLGTRFPCNPGHLLWRSLIERFGVPFVKIQLLRENPVSVLDTNEIVSVVQTRNPVLAAMIKTDINERLASHPRKGFAPWFESMLGPQWRGQWPELRGALSRDARWEPDSMFSRANAVWIQAPLFFGKAMRYIARRVVRVTGRVLTQNGAKPSA